MESKNRKTINDYFSEGSPCSALFSLTDTVLDELVKYAQGKNKDEKPVLLQYYDDVASKMSVYIKYRNKHLSKLELTDE